MRKDRRCDVSSEAHLALGHGSFAVFTAEKVDSFSSRTDCRQRLAHPNAYRFTVNGRTLK